MGILNYNLYVKISWCGKEGGWVNNAYLATAIEKLLLLKKIKKLHNSVYKKMLKGGGHFND